MKTLYLDIFSGISGDMFIGAMLDLGVSFEALQDELKKLGVDDYSLSVTRGEKSSISGTKFDVHLQEEGSHHHHGSHAHTHPHNGTHYHHHEEDGHGHSHSHATDAFGFLSFSAADQSHSHDHGEAGHSHGRNFAEIRELISKSSLSDWVKTKAIGIFTRIALAEGKIHGQPPDQVHFHEVGAVDSIVDIVGACIALEALGKPQVLASEVTEGTGWIRCAHGRFPIPAPATLNILAQRGIPISQCEEPNELVTPTGAAILAEFVERFEPLTQFRPEKVGFGLGQRDNRTRPNVLRAVLGHADQVNSASVSADWETDTIAVIETNLDDINAEVLGFVVEKCFAQGALDVFHTPVQMKKNRPGVLLTVLCQAKATELFMKLLLTDTTAFGVRYHMAERRKLKREIIKVSTPYGEVEVKIGSLDGRITQQAPEFESCRKVAEKAGVPIKDIYRLAIQNLK
ncbi:MAG: nickel pincer cofactor biosynthesis protein LarC [Verrucomicrobiales bacterium]